jgi:hypothetical protein
MAIALGIPIAASSGMVAVPARSIPQSHQETQVKALKAPPVAVDAVF